MITHAEKKPIKILHVFGRMNRGGAEIRSLEMLRRIDRGRFLPHFLSLSGLPGELDGEIESLGGKVHLCKLQRGFSKRFSALLEKEKYDIVHSHVFFFSGYILRLAEKAGVRGRIAHLRSTQDGHASTPRRVLQRLVSRWLVHRHCTEIIAVGDGAMAALFGEKWARDPRRRIIPDGIDAAPFREPPDREAIRREFGLADDCPLVIHVGNFREAKNHLYLIDVFNHIKKRLPASVLLLVGGGGHDLEMRVRAKVGDLNLDDSVVFAGSRADVPRLLLAADLMVFPSTWEGLPGVVLEASAAGLPVIASNLPGILEMTPHLPQIQCLDLRRGAEAWATAACDLISPGHNANYRNEMKAYFAASPFTIEKCTSETCSVWLQAMRE